MKNKTMKNLVIVAVTILGSTYLLEKYNNYRKRKIETQRYQPSDETEENRSRTYIPLYQMMPDMSSQNSDKIDYQRVTEVEVSDLYLSSTYDKQSSQEKPSFQKIQKKKAI